MELERLFDRYRRKGDSAALAEVFDRGAPEILKVALHLARDPADAEDLLQQTFITAIENAADFDARQRLVPWLLGILANLARRRRKPPPDPGRLGRGGGPTDPAAAAERRELGAELSRAIEGLPEPYRSVLRMKLEEDLPPAAIAHALKRAPGTVRAQIHRGLDLLRRVLPAGLALGGLGGLAVATRGLAAVRADVLAASAAKGAASGAAIAGGIAMSKKKTALVTALLVALGGGMLAGGAWLLRTSPEAERAEGGRASPEAPTPAERSQTAERRPAAAPGPPPGSPALREVAAATGHGSVDVTVDWDDVRPRSPAGLDVILAHGASWRETRASGVDGVARFPRVPEGMATATTFAGTGGGVAVKVEPGRHAEVTLRLGPPRTDPVPLAGEVVDAAGAPVPGAWILFPNVAGVASVVAVADDRGRFALPAVHTGTWIGARARGFAASEAVQVDGPQVRLVLPGPGGAVAGRVLDEANRPVPYTLVRHEGVRIRPDTWTDAEGAFRFEGCTPGTMRLAVAAAGHAPWAGEVVVRAGAVAEIVIRLAPGGSVLGTVTDPRGRPVQGARVTAGRRFAVTDAAGRYRLVDLAGGLADLEVFHAVAGQASVAVDVAAPGETVRDVTLTVKETVAGRVVDGDGNPLAGWDVVLAAETGYTMQQVRSDADGFFAFSAPMRASGIVRVYAPDGRAGEGWTSRLPLPVLEVRDVAPGTGDLVVRVPAAALPSSRATGRVVGEDGRPPAQFEIHFVDPARMLRGSFRVESAGGSFDIGPLAAGRYEVHVFEFDAVSRPPWVFRLSTGLHDLVAGETLALGTLAILPRGSIVLRMRGEAWKEIPDLQYVVTGTEIRWYDRTSAGTVRIDGLPPGTYRLGFIGRDAAGPILPDIAVPPGGAASVEAEVRVGVVRRLAFAVPASGGARWLSVAARDARGVLVMDDAYAKRGEHFHAILCAVPGTYAVEARLPHGAVARGTFEVPGEEEIPVLLR